VDLRGSGSGLIAFEFTEVGGSRDMGPERTLDCAPYRLDPDHAITSAITKSGGYSETGPDADFLRSFFAGDEVHLSPGNWTIAAIAMFSATGCATDHTLRATVLVHVTS
jgi:hypothetical protein